MYGNISVKIKRECNLLNKELNFINLLVTSSLDRGIIWDRHRCTLQNNLWIWSRNFLNLIHSSHIKIRKVISFI